MEDLIVAQKGQCDNYCIFLASKFFKTIDDYINLELGCSRFYGNLTKFFYNPISVTKKTMYLFPYLRTLHLYNSNDEYLTGGQIQWYVSWVKISYNETIKLKQERNIEFKNIEFNYKDEMYSFAEYLHKNPRNYNWMFECEIPNGVKSIGSHVFSGMRKLVSITIPSSIKSIEKDCFHSQNQLKELQLKSYLKDYDFVSELSSCTKLTSIQMPMKSNWKLIGRKLLMKENNSTIKTIHFPSTIRLINNIKI